MQASGNSHLSVVASNGLTLTDGLIVPSQFRVQGEGIGEHFYVPGY